MTDSNNFYLPKLSPEIIEKVRIYQSKNCPLETARSRDNKLERCRYRDGFVIIQTVEGGDIIDCYKMLDDELQKMIKRYDEASQILKDVADSARRLRSTGIK